MAKFIAKNKNSGFSEVVDEKGREMIESNPVIFGPPGNRKYTFTPIVEPETPKAKPPIAKKEKAEG